MRKIYAASWKLSTLTAEAVRVLGQLVMFLTVFFQWMYKMKYSCYQESSLIHGWFVYRVFGWEMRRLSKPIIRFRMASFSFFTLLDAYENYKGSSDPFPTWQLSVAASRNMVSLSNYCIYILFHKVERSLWSWFMHVCIEIWLRHWSDLVRGLI